MYVHPYALEHMLQGEPTPDAMHREEYFSEKRADEPVEEIVEPGMIRRAQLLRAQVIAGVGRFFA